MEKYGYNDSELVKKTPWNSKKWIALIFAILLILDVWLFLDSKLLFGKAWISETYDNIGWHTNEGGLHTYGAWDLETHIWKTEYILKYFPNFQWNPFWYLGMPLLKYYQVGFYIVHISLILITGLSAARAALLLIIFGHLLATFITFILCYKFSRKLIVSALCSVFLLVSTFISLRSYGWEPISIIFLFLYPLGLLIFFRKPTNPFRYSMIIIMVIAYLCHPLIFFSLCMTMGLYLLSLAVRKTEIKQGDVQQHYIWKYFALILCCILVGGLQFLPQMSYSQATSGAHMGVSYLPFYHVAFNVISIRDFFFDAGNLKGPGPVVMIACLMLITLFIYRRSGNTKKKNNIFSHEAIAGLALIMLSMILFYYLEIYNIFPMNLLRSIQYHRIIPEFIIIAAALTASISNILEKREEKIIYYTVLIAFVAVSMIIVYNVQSNWKTTDSISYKPEFIYETVAGRISFPYTDQSLSVRSSFREIPQVYGYYEQGVTNSYTDEIFSVSSGFHNKNLSVLYLQAGNVGRLYVNTEEGSSDYVMTQILKGLPYVHEYNARYGYFEIPLNNPDFSQTLDIDEATKLKEIEPGCRIIFKEKYCGSVKEEFIESDPEEIRYLEAYVKLIEKNNTAKAHFKMLNPNHYVISVTDANKDTAVLVKMTYDNDFKAKINEDEIKIDKIGPDFMLIYPAQEGDYEITLTYPYLPKIVLIGGIVSLISFICVSGYFLFKPKNSARRFILRRGDLQ